MCGFERLAKVLRNIESFFNRNRSAVNTLHESLAFHQFEHEEARRTGFFLDVVNRSDIGMVQRCENFSFSLEPAHAIGIPRELIRQNFDCDVTLEFCIARAIHLAHAALAQKSSNFKRAKSCTYIYRHWIQLRSGLWFRGIMPGSDKTKQL